MCVSVLTSLPAGSGLCLRCRLSAAGSAACVCSVCPGRGPAAAWRCRCPASQRQLWMFYQMITRSDRAANCSQLNLRVTRSTRPSRCPGPPTPRPAPLPHIGKQSWSRCLSQSWAEPECCRTCSTLQERTKHSLLQAPCLLLIQSYSHQTWTSGAHLNPQWGPSLIRGCVT